MPKNNPSHKSLAIDFNAYTDGDLTFKVELIGLMINNLRELQQALDASPAIFSDVCHKVKSTVGIINHQGLKDLIQDLKNPQVLPDQKPVKVILLHDLCEQIIGNLEDEKKSGA